MISTHKGARFRSTNQIPDLINKNDCDVFPCQKTLEAVVDVADARVFVDDEEIWASRFVHLPDSPQEKSSARVLIPNH